jgi:hypothetical protein
VTLRLVLSIFAGVLTFYLVGCTILVGAGRPWLLKYCDVLGIPTFFARFADRYYYYCENDTGMWQESARAAHIAGSVSLAMWTLFFGAVYFRFVFRGPRNDLTNRSSQPLTS